MGMATCFALLSDANIARVLADPPLIWQVVAPDDPEAYEQARAAAQPPSLLGKLFGRSRATSDPAAPISLTPPEGEAPDLDKAWHGIHFLLTGTAQDGEPPLNFLVAGGQPVGDIEIGYRPARVYPAAETRQIAAALAGVTDAQVRDRYDPARMRREEVYPDIWGRTDSGQDEGLEYVMENLGILRGILQTAIDANLGLVVYLT
jgi:uncharacterized protein DUF1877